MEEDQGKMEGQKVGKKECGQDSGFLLAGLTMPPSLLKEQYSSTHAGLLSVLLGLLLSSWHPKRATEVSTGCG